MRALGELHQYEVLGRRLASDADATPKVYRMKIFAPDEVVARSRFWYFLKKLRKLKKANGEIVGLSEIFEPRPLQPKNYGFWLRYDSRSGTHNMYKEFRDLTMNRAATQLYRDLAARHRVRGPSVQIIRAAVIPAGQCRRPIVTQMHDSKIRFPLPHRVIKGKSIYVANRPSTHHG